MEGNYLNEEAFLKGDYDNVEVAKEEEKSEARSEPSVPSVRTVESD